MAPEQGQEDRSETREAAMLASNKEDKETNFWSFSLPCGRKIEVPKGARKHTVWTKETKQLIRLTADGRISNVGPVKIRNE
jgi:hypothetical protein